MTVLGPSIVTSHVPVPLQVDQPANSESAVGLAVSVTTVPSSYGPVDGLPPTVSATVPVPVPVVFIASVYKLTGSYSTSLPYSSITIFFASLLTSNPLMRLLLAFIVKLELLVLFISVGGVVSSARPITINFSPGAA